MSLGKETKGNGDKMSGTHQEQELHMLDKERRPPSSHAQSCHQGIEPQPGKSL
jgi:hypothetical protein